MKKPVIFITIAFISGIALGRGFLYFPFTVTFFILAAVIISALLIRFNRLSVQHILLTLVPAFIGLTSSIYSAAYFPADHYTRIFKIDRERHEIVGRIVSPLDRDPDRIAFIMSLRKIDGIPAAGKMRVSVRDAETGVGYGDVIRVTGRVYRPRGFNNPGGFDYPAYLASSGIYCSVSVKDAGRITTIQPGRGIFRTIQDWRERIRRAFLGATTGPGSAILQAMVLGEEGGLTDDIRDRFMAAGVTHILSISGSHLGLVAILCFGLVRGLLFLLPERVYHRLTLYADPKKIAAWLTFPPVIFYAFLAGGQVATIRSLVMISAALAALILDRQNGLMHSLAFAAVLILIASPQALFDISFQLSYISVLSIGFVASLWSDLRIHSEGFLKKLRDRALLLGAISLAAGIVTSPLVAHYFNQVSLIGIMSNIIVVPFAGIVVVPLGLSSGVLSLFFDRLPFAGLNQSAADAFYSVVAVFSHLPFAEFHPPSPEIIWLITYAVLIISFAGYVRARLLYRTRPLEYSAGISKIHMTGMAVAGIAMLAYLAVSFMPAHKARLTFMDVGQGDCALLELPSGRNIMIDGGGAHDGRFDMGRRVVAPYLWNRGISKLDMVIASHPHPDHMNGLKFILKKFNVSQVWSSGRDAFLPEYQDFNRVISERKIHHTIVFAGVGPYTAGEARLVVLHPKRGFSPLTKKRYAAENNRSLVVRAEVGDKVLLFTGDIGAEAESEILRDSPGVRCDLLKVPHHGSKSSSTERFVQACRPHVAVVSVGIDNLYHHPADEVIERYEQSGARVYRTDRDGAVIIRWDRNGMNVVPWAESILEKVHLDNPRAWITREKENWGRLGIRTMGI